MPVHFSSLSRAQAFLWLAYRYYEGGDSSHNPFDDSKSKGLSNTIPPLVELSAAEMNTIGAVHKKPNMHRSLLPYHAPDGTVFGWTYKQLGWPMGHGGLVPSL